MSPLEIAIALAILIGLVWAVLSARGVHVHLPVLQITAVVGLLLAVVWALLASLSVLMFGLSAADLSHEPEASITFPGARVEREVLQEARFDLLWGGESAHFRREYRSAASLSDVVAFYRQELESRGWFALLGLANYDACARGLVFSLRGTSVNTFQTDISPFGRFTHPPECKQGTPPAPEAVALTAVIAFTVYIARASLFQRRARRARGAPLRAAGGVAQWAPAFAFVPYLFLNARPGPTIAPGELVVYAGLALIVAGAGFALWAASTLGSHFDLELEVHAGHAVVRDGPYRFVRHPVYVGLAVHLAGACIASGNLALTLGILLVGFPVL